MDKNPRYIELESAMDFSRLVCALEPLPKASFLHEYDGRKVISIQMDILKERPIIYYTPMDGAGRYLAYGIRNGREEMGVADSTSDRSRLYSPIIRIKGVPESLKPGGADDGGCPCMELEDLDSLAKLSEGLEDESFPLFAFPSCGKWLLGVFMNFSDDGEAYFCHVVLDDDPKMPFLRYSPSNGVEPSFVDCPSDHGYSYIKIIRLKAAHPLIENGRLSN